MTQRSSASHELRPWRGRLGRAAALSGGAVLLSIVMTWPLASGMGHLGRTPNSGDARFAVWNVAWVAHALTTDPWDLYDANIFYPHRHALAFSEANIGAGLLAVPAWVATKNPFVAFNLVVLMAFSASVVVAWQLARHLTGDAAASVTAAVIFAFCPYVFAHTAHIQLMMTAGIPLCLLLFHRLADAPSVPRGIALGGALAAQALLCAYYGISAGLTVGYATLFLAWYRQRWRSRTYWMSIGAAGAVAVGLVLPFFLPYLEIQNETGFARSLDDARHWSAYFRSYLASGAHAHAWLLPFIKDWNDAVLFPGFLGIGLGIAGGVAAFRDRPAERPADDSNRETALLYASTALLTFWASLGPRAGLYTLLYEVIPVFSFLRAPERMGIGVTLCLAILSAFAVRALRLRYAARTRTVAVAACMAALVELNAIPFDWREVEPIPASYRVLAGLPRGPLVEFPFYARRIDFHIHSRYMLNSTAHWQPLVNGYSDHIPVDFRTDAATLATFPSRESFTVMRQRRVRYLTIHRSRYGRAAAAEIEQRLEPYLNHLRLAADDGDVVLYEIMSWPR